MEAYKPRGLLPIDVNENNITILLDAIAYLFETDLGKIVLGYHYRRKSVQKKYDKPYADARVKKKIMRKLKEKKKKNDVRWKIANIIVRTAYEKGYAIVLVRLGKNPAEKMISRIRDKQLRHRIFQASFKGVQRANEEKAREYGVPIIYEDPKNTSRQCPIHNAEIVYENGSRIGVCSVGGEKRHRDVASLWNLLIRARLGDGSTAPSLGGLILNGSPVPLGSTATHEPIEIPRSLWARWNSLGATMNLYRMIGMTPREKRREGV